MSDFKAFSAAVHAQYSVMAQHELFTVDVKPDDVYDGYLAAFPEGTNPIFRKRTEHDCSCCRNFIKNLGAVVAIIDGQLVSVWDIPTDGLALEYVAVTEYLSAYVKNFAITGIFRSAEPSYGAETSKEVRENDGGTYVHTWNHFYGKVHAKHHNKQPGPVVGDYASGAGVFRRGLIELTGESLDTVIDLTESNNLYRGEQVAAMVKGFRDLRNQAAPLDIKALDIFVWANAGHFAARIRNTAIGTLLQDLSAGVDLEKAVKSYEDKVSGTNYKRPKALITPGMIKAAMDTIESLGIKDSLERRMASLSDVSVNNVLWVDNSAKAKMKDGIEALPLAETRAPAVNTDHAIDISIADFMASVLPTASAIDLVVKNNQLGNFVTVTAPVHADAPNLFPWSNGFAWSYGGNVADAIKERVKAAGGQVEGDLCCRLAWDYTDDLDLHMKEPGDFVAFHHRKSSNGGMLDVDANGGNGMMAEPVENIFYTDRGRMREGRYTLAVNNYSRRSNGVGFTIQIEFDGQLHEINYSGVLHTDKTIEVATIEYKNGEFKIIKSLPATTGAAKSKEHWGVKTEQPAKVSAIMYSPNYWDENASGNRHVIFALDGCTNPEPCRGFFNEQLGAELNTHRKVFEVLGDKTKCPPTADQISGVGFSTTRADKVLVQVTSGKSRKTYVINF